MQATDFARVASAHRSALAQLDNATVALQGAELGALSPSLQTDLRDLLAVQERIERRLRTYSQVAEK